MFILFHEINIMKKKKNNKISDQYQKTVTKKNQILS